MAKVILELKNKSSIVYNEPIPPHVDGPIDNDVAYLIDVGRSPGSDLPGYRHLISTHQPATTALTGTYANVSKHKGHTRASIVRSRLYFKDILFSNDYSGTGLDWQIPTAAPDFSGPLAASSRNAAISRLYSKIRSFESPSQLGESFGELGQTLSLIKRPMSGLRDLTDYVMNNHTRLLKKSRANNSKQIAKGLANLLLEYRFGVKPLVSDITSAYESLKNRDKWLKYYRFRCTGSSQSEIAQEVRGEEHNGIQIFFRRTEQSFFKTTFKGEYRETHYIDQYSVSQSLGLTWREAIPTLYNLAPYSFLLDYISNLQDLVSAVAVPWSNVAWCNRTNRSRVDSSYQAISARASTPDLYNLTSFSPGRSSLSISGFSRSEQTNIPMPTFEFHRPGVTQLQNVVALMASRIPVINFLSKRANKSSGGALDREFQLAVRDRSIRVPYPFHSHRS